MASNNVKLTTDLRNPKELGIHHRLVFMTGPNKGKVYYLKGKRVLIGRGDKVDIQILDTKISREHAELSFVDNAYVISDLSNQNGIIINDEKVKQQRINDGEKIVIGQTVIKYNFFDIKEEQNEITEYDENNKVEEKKSKIKNKAFVKSSANFEEEIVDSSTNKTGGSKLIIMIIFIGAIIFLFMGDDDNSKVVKKSKSNQEAFDIESEAANLKKSTKEEDPEIKRNFEAHIHSGRREYREGNYFRAMEEFRRADLLIPGSGLAGFLMSRAKQRLDEDVTKNFDAANKDLDAKKYQSAQIAFCAVMQLLQKFPEDVRYKNAEEKIRALETELGKEKGEIKCFEEKPVDSKN